MILTFLVRVKYKWWGDNKMKYKGFALTLEIALSLVVIIILLSGALSLAGIGWYRNYQSDAFRDKCNQLDYAVRRYGQNHLLVDKASEHYDADENFRYHMVQTYPASQAKLADLHTPGYLHFQLKIEDLQWRPTADGGVIQDSNITFYKTKNTRTKYRIEVILPNGKKYVTPGSSSL